MMAHIISTTYIILLVLTFGLTQQLQSNLTLPESSDAIVPPIVAADSANATTPATTTEQATTTTISTSSTGTTTTTTTEIPTTTTPVITELPANQTSIVGKEKNSKGETIGNLNTTILPSSTTTARPQVTLSPYGVPNNCSAYKQFASQPQYNPFAKILKCCPEGQNFHYNDKKEKYCAPETIPFNVNVISARFYLGCIEDEEKKIELDVAHMITCSSGLVYNQNYNDHLYILQNGSLLRIDNNFDSYDIFVNYCLDMDTEENILTAIVCMNNDGLMIVTYAQVWIYIICMITSVPCLIATAILYSVVADLRDIHGKSLVYHSLCLASGLLMLSITQFRTTIDPYMGYFIQYFLLSSFFWLFLMCVDITVHTWFYLPKGLDVREKRERLHITVYVIIAMGIPLLLVGATYLHQLSEDTVYHFKAENVSQQYFLPPIAILLSLSLILLFATLYGFYKLNALNANMFIQKMKLQHKDTDLRKPKLNTRLIAKVERMAKKTLILYIIMFVIWMMEILSFYTSGKLNPIMFDICNALQGMFIFIIYVCLPAPWQTIKRWYNDRGSIDLRSTELQVLNPNRHNANTNAANPNNNTSNTA